MNVDQFEFALAICLLLLPVDLLSPLDGSLSAVPVLVGIFAGVFGEVCAEKIFVVLSKWKLLVVQLTDNVGDLQSACCVVGVCGGGR